MKEGGQQVLAVVQAVVDVVGVQAVVVAVAGREE